MQSVGVAIVTIYSLYEQVKTGGGVSFNTTCKLTRIDEKMIRMILNEYSMWSVFEKMIRMFLNEDRMSSLF